MNESPPPTEMHASKRRFGCLWLMVVSCLLGLAWCHYTPLNRFV